MDHFSVSSSYTDQVLVQFTQYKDWKQGTVLKLQYVSTTTPGGGGGGLCWSLDLIKGMKYGWKRRFVTLFKDRMRDSVF